MKKHVLTAVKFISALLVLSLLAWLFLFNGLSTLKKDAASIQDKGTPVVNIGFIGSRDDLMKSANPSINAGLMMIDSNSVANPSMLVKDMKLSDDRLVLSFTMKDNLRWSDGSRMTSSDIVDSLKSSITDKNNYYSKYIYSNLDSLTANGSTIQFRLKKPMAVLNWLLADNAYSIRKAGVKDNSVTSGAFSVSGSRMDDGHGNVLKPSDSNLVLVRNPYYPVKAASSYVSVNVYNDDNTAVTAFNKNEVSYLVSDGRIDGAFNGNDYEINRGNGTRRTVLAFNSRASAGALLSDVHFRQGFRQAIDNNAIMQSLGDDGIVMTNPLIPGSYGYVADTSFPYDVASGRYLSTSYFGVKNTRVLWQASRGHAFGEVLDSNLANIVQYTRWEEVDDGTYNQRVESRDYDMVLMDVKGLDPFRDFLNNNQITGIDNQPDVDTAYNAIFSAADDNALRASIRGASDTMDNASIVDWLYASKTTIVNRKGMNAMPAGFSDVNLRLEYAGVATGN